jgi:hypothetical protein
MAKCRLPKEHLYSADLSLRGTDERHDFVLYELQSSSPDSKGLYKETVCDERIACFGGSQPFSETLYDLDYVVKKLTDFSKKRAMIHMTFRTDDSSSSECYIIHEMDTDFFMSFHSSIHPKYKWSWDDFSYEDNKIC